MMPTVVLSNLAAYFVQVLVLASACGILLALLRIDRPRVRYHLLRATLVVCLILPWLQARAAPPPGSVSASVSLATPADAGSAAPAEAVLPAEWAVWIAPLLLAGIALRLAWLAIGLMRLGTLRHAGEPAERAEHEALQRTLGTAADLRYLAGFRQPVTFGLRRPVVVLPESLRREPAALREAVLTHELLHVRRRDWAWVLAEELVRAAFWFHPAVWWLVSRIQLAREEVVDALAVACTGQRRAYVQALLTFADGVPLAPAPAFARKRHLFRRMVLISREDVMTARRLVISAVTMVAVMMLGGWYVVRAFPLVSATGAQILHETPGPLESAAQPISRENPIPRRVEHEPPRYPVEAAGEDAWVSVTLRLTLNSSGSVAEARVIASRLRLGNRVTSLDDGRAKPAYDAVVNAAVSAVSRWRYAPPAHAPISFDTTFFFAPNLPVSETPAAAPRPLGRLAEDNALRVGGNVRPPAKIKDVRPVYPQEAKEAGIQGVVILEIRINEAGTVDEARVMRSIPELDEAAVAAVRQWQFVPTLMNGVPTPVILVVTIQFTLQQ